MGLYDIIKIKAKCPACKTESLIEFQTKSLDNKMRVFTPGDRISDFDDEFDFIELVGLCKCEQCLKKDPEGWGTFIKAKIRLKNGIITNNIYDIETQGA